MSKASDILDNVSKVIVGKRNVSELVLTSIIAGGHVLLEDVPGTGKTMMAKAFAKSIDGQFSRIQFTPDLLPSDITGVHVFNQKEGEFVFRRGPVFANVILADEINRATPRTQSALLEIKVFFFFKSFSSIFVIPKAMLCRCITGFMPFHHIK